MTNFFSNKSLRMHWPLLKAGDHDLPSTWYSMYLNRFHCPSQIENPSLGSGAWNIIFLQQKMIFSQKFRLTRLIRWTQHWFHPNQIFPRPPGPSSHRVDLCYTQQLRQLGHVSHFSSITASFLTCALWRHLVIPNPVGPVCHPVGAGEVPCGVHLRSLCGNVFSVKMLKPILVML